MSSLNISTPLRLRYSPFGMLLSTIKDEAPAKIMSYFYTLVILMFWKTVTP
jgi:hypothetical protein